MASERLAFKNAVPNVPAVPIVQDVRNRSDAQFKVQRSKTIRTDIQSNDF